MAASLPPPPAPPAARPARGLIALGVAALLLLHAVLALRAVAGKSVTVDEIFHVTGGYFFDRFGDYRIHPENGVLPQRLHALPAVLAGAKSPVLENDEYWRTSDMFVMSYQFFYESGNDHWPLLMRARALNLGFSLALLLLVFGWAWRLAGPAAGFTALTLGALSPTLLAHGPLATTDAAAAFFLTASVTAFWWQLRRGGNGPLLVSAAVFGLACVAKYSSVLLPPVFILLLIAHALTAPAADRRPGRLALLLAVHAVVAWAVIWACFGFRYTAFSPGVPRADQFVRDWSWMLERARWQAAPIAWLRDWRLFPEAYLYGYTHTFVSSLSRSAFLAGDHSDAGWRLFFPLAFLWKSTPAELLGAALAAVAAGLQWRRWREWAGRLAPLLALAAVYGGAAVASHLNIGHRHLLPLYPALFILAGLAAARLFAPRFRLVLPAVLLAAQLAATTGIHPHYLAYFNPLAGGPTNGWRLLVDSSLDWGQDLPALKAWLDQNNTGAAAQPVFLSYFGSGEPDYYHIRAQRLLFTNGFKLPLRWTQPRGGLYCISATSLQEVYNIQRGPWTEQAEQDYQNLRHYEAEFAHFHDPAVQARLHTIAPAIQWEQARIRYEMLRHARLCAYLRTRQPDAMVGYSILIYRLSDDDVERALTRDYRAWTEPAVVR